ncbi:homeodomain transcription factor ste12 [Entophlyctis sp. JEL0112]|nr:homeodomain transcription factor ste12 [Entophlyctis sp. JEL0112]
MTPRKRKSPIQNANGESADYPNTVIPTIHEPVVPLDHSAMPDISHLPVLEQLKVFLVSAPSNWRSNEQIRRFTLHPTKETIACVLWNNLYHITGTDILKALQFRFAEFGRPVVLHKKFEEGVFSDLRNLKPGVAATLEEPRSPLLDFLFKSSCIRTQKKQKVFYWFSVPHDRLFMDALERDLKRESQGQEPTTAPIPGLTPEQTLALAKEHCQPVMGYQQISSVAPTPTRVFSRRDSIASGMSATPSGIPDIQHSLNSYGESYLDPDALNHALSSVSANSSFISHPTFHQQYDGNDQMQFELHQHLPLQNNRPRAVSLSLQRNPAIFAPADLSTYNDDSRAKKPAQIGRNRAVSMSSHTGHSMNYFIRSERMDDSVSERIAPQFNFGTANDLESRRMSIGEPISLELPQAPSPHFSGFSAHLQVPTPKQLAITDTYIDPAYLQLQMHHTLSSQAMTEAHSLHDFDTFRVGHSTDDAPPDLIQDFSMRQGSPLMTPLSIMASLEQPSGGTQLPADWHQQQLQLSEDHLQIQPHQYQQILQFPQGSFSAFFNIDESPTMGDPSPLPPVVGSEVSGGCE